MRKEFRSIERPRARWFHKPEKKTKRSTAAATITVGGGQRLRSCSHYLLPRACFASGRHQTRRGAELLLLLLHQQIRLHSCAAPWWARGIRAEGFFWCLFPFLLLLYLEEGMSGRRIFRAMLDGWIFCCCVVSSPIFRFIASERFIFHSPSHVFDRSSSVHRRTEIERPRSKTMT